ncbi:CIR protein PIR protein [Plasmodium vinckei brucechwatti]|uniref:CIR protein PIR protein n=1 Tax=Plasmodium vinckei brucechwatti TaxID=119398 RepID=A0A6V7S1N6_PLAVN|nr:CIR protein PIR protein [Plasmodium vinckei brucechwatti]
MEPKELCENFIAADKIINDQIAGNLTIEDKTKYPNFNKYCSNIDCKTDMQINGLSEDLFNQLGNQIEDEYYEYFTMWLSDKLFKIVNEDDNPQINDITLNSAYEKYLKNNNVNLNYWRFLDIKQGLKEVNLMHMKLFYKLLNNICKAIVYYKQNEDDIKKFISNSTDCYNQYSSLYDSVPKCSSYHHLLDNLKKTYEDFKNSVHDKIKNEYSHLAGDLQTLKTADGEDLIVTEKFKEFDFNSSECNPQKAKETTKLKETNPSSPQSLPVSYSQDKTKLKEPQESGKTDQNEPDDSKSEQKGSNDGHVNEPGSSNNQIDSPKSSDDGKENLSSVPKGSKSAQGSSNGGTDSQGSIDSGSGGESSGSGTDGSGSGSGGEKDSGGGVPGSGTNGGSKTLGDQDPTHPSGEPNGYLSSNWGISFNLMGYMPSASSIYQSSKNILTSATNKISDTYTNTVDIVKGAYDSTMTSITGAYNNAMTSITDAYDRTTNYIGNAVNSVTSQLYPFSTSQLGGNQPGSNSSGGRTDTSNHSPPPSPTQTPPSLPPSTSQLSQTPSSPQPHSNETQDKLQSTVQNGASNTLQQPDPSTGTGGVQTMAITKSTLSSSSTGPSITGSGITTRIVVKMNEKSLIWCIAQNKKYGILGIGIISISIFAFLAIMYKYLSLGYTSKSRRKKNMKKVINSIGGKRPVQIIIKSYDRNKDLKPIINSADRKKDPLLNIYKLMQADPIPFINLFFLLIFFVYKRQLNYLEL